MAGSSPHHLQHICQEEARHEILAGDPFRRLSGFLLSSKPSCPWKACQGPGKLPVTCFCHGNSQEAGLGGGCSLACHLPSFPRRCRQGLTWALSNGPSLLRLPTHVHPLLTLSQHTPFEDPGESSKTNQGNSLDSRASDIQFNKTDILEMGFRCHPLIGNHPGTERIPV